MKTLIALLLLACAFAAAGGDGPTGARADAASAQPSHGQPPEERPPQAAVSPAQKVARLVALLVGLYVSLIVLVLLLENHLIYFPTRHPAGEWEAHGLAVEDCFFETEDGLKLHAWWQPAASPQRGPVLLWFHGNAGNLTHRAENLRMLATRELSVLIVDYRGYGKSEGRPSEKGIYLDGEAAYRYLTEERGIAPDRIVCLGRSLGASVALHVAGKYSVAGVVLESPFASARRMARRMMPILPLGPFIRSRFDNVGMVAKLDVPVLVVHGDRDEVVPFKQGRAVFEAAREPKEFYKIPDAGHNDTYFVGGEPYFKTLMDFCRRSTQQGE